MVGKKTSAKKAAGKSPAKKSTVKTAAKSATKTAAKSSSAKKSAGTSALKKAPVKKSAGKSAGNSADNYTRPELREKIKKEVIAGDKGGRAGQWSARKAQLLAHEYEAEGGGYKHPRNAAQKSLKQWGDEHWHTADGKEAIQGEETHRYLPDAAWKKLSPAQKEATDKKKVAASKKGKQFVSNTPAASRARKSATKSAAKHAN